MKLPSGDHAGAREWPSIVNREREQTESLCALPAQGVLQEQTERSGIVAWVMFKVT